MPVLTEAEVPVDHKRRAVSGETRRRLRKKRKSTISKSKACTILEEGTANKQPLTDRQRRFMGARCND